MDDITKKSSYSLTVSGEGKNILVAYALWWFLGFIGLHRIYLDKKNTGIAFIVMFILGFITFFIAWIPLGIWWVLDAYFVYKYVNESNPNNNLPNLLAFKVSSHKTRSADEKNLKPVSVEVIEKLYELYEKGAITKEEFESQKKEILKTS